MGEYLKTILTVVIAVGIITTIAPKGAMSGYSKMLSGVVVMAVILAPVLKLEDYRPDTFTPDIKEIGIQSNTYLMEEYEKELSKNIKNHLKEETGIEFEVLVFADKNDEIIEIKQVEISPFSSKYAKIITDYTGIDERRIVEK